MDDNRKNYQKEYRDEYKTRVKRINLTLTKQQYQAFTKASGNQKVTTYIKDLALAGLNQQANIPENLQEELKTLRFAILNIANNVNQIARHSNTVRSITSAEENNLLQHIKQLEDAVSEYTKGRIMESDHDC